MAAHLVDTGPLNRVGDGLSIARQDAVNVLLQPLKQRRVTDEAVFYHFTQTRRQLAVWQGGQGVGVNDHALHRGGKRRISRIVQGGSIQHQSTVQAVLTAHAQHYA